MPEQAGIQQGAVEPQSLNFRPHANDASIQLICYPIPYSLFPNRRIDVALECS
jgi:hypothetical protein